LKNKLNKNTIFEAKTLEEAYKNASIEYECSIVDLKSRIIQSSSNGFFGLFKKNAIIEILEVLNNEEESKKIIKNETKLENTDIIVLEIKEKVNELFNSLCYNIDEIKVTMHDDNTVLVHFTGEDCALLIGKEGYRYKAISYVLFNWIHDTYNLMLRLEIAEFLQSQEEGMQKYIDSILPDIKEQVFYKTKILDGILVHIALTILRKELPDKYVAVKQNINKEKYILINEYKNK
jgi:spoIIIJ-associated protein